jgi:hypothetical protein
MIKEPIKNVQLSSSGRKLLNSHKRPLLLKIGSQLAYLALNIVVDTGWLSQTNL